MTQATSISTGMASGLSANPRKWWALAATSIGLFMALLDVTIVNVALPTIGTDLNASIAELQWVVNAYALALAVFLVTAGRLGDLFGRKRFFMIGLALFALGSLGCGLSNGLRVDGLSSIQVLIAARALQGIGGSIMLPLSLALISATFHGRERGVALGIYGGVTGLATAIGPVLGGVLVEKVSWQSIFYINVPIGLAGIALCAWAVRESFDQNASRTIDIFGLVTLSLSLLCLVLALIQGNDADKGWTSPYILTLVGVALVALAAFIVGELMLKNPMVDPRLFANASFTGAAIVAFTLSAGLYSLFFFLTLYLQNFLGFSALNAGLRVLPLSGLILVTAPLAGALMSRLGAKPFLAGGMAILVVAVLLMGRISPQDTQSDWLVLLVPFVLGGLGSGLVNPPIADVAVGTVSRDRAGMASGISGVCRQVGTAFGIASLAAILTNHYNSTLADGINRLAVANVSPAQQQSILQSITSGLQQAGVFAGSTGFRSPPPQFAQFASTPLFTEVQKVVRSSYIGGTVTLMHIAAGFLALGMFAALFLVKRSDLHTSTEDALPTTSPGA